MRVCACFASGLFFYLERWRRRWRQGVGGRGVVGGGVDARIPLRPRLPALSRRRLEREEDRRGNVSEKNRKEIRKCEKEKEIDKET